MTKKRKDEYEFDIKEMRTSLHEDGLLDPSTDVRIAARREARKARQRKGKDPTQAELELQRKKERKRIHSRRTLLFVLVFAAVFLFGAYKASGVLKLRAEKERVQKELDALNEKQKQLEAEYEEVESDEYVEQAARSELHMIRDGELLYIINVDEEEPDEGELKAK